MKRILKIVFLIILLLITKAKLIKADGYGPGYSEWSTEKSNDENEVETTQYGRKTPLTWSAWSNDVPSSPYQKTRIGQTQYYSYAGSNHYWNNSGSKELFTWDFGSQAHVTYLYADVDTYVGGSWTNYIGPPLYLYGDGKLLCSTGSHDCLKNWNPHIDCYCRYLTLSMGDGGGEGRNKTSIVGTWATTTKTEYAYVTSWNNGSDWRFNTPYKDVYGADPQIPVSRKVYSHPLTYTINYDLVDGKVNEELKTSYTVLDEFKLPLAYKLGYEFVGFYQNATLYTEVKKGSVGNLNLKAEYKRKKPNLIVGSYSFLQAEKELPIAEFLTLINAKGNDELDGDLSDQIVISSISYLDEGVTDTYPQTLDLHNAQMIEVEFSLTNSGKQTVKLTRNFYILKEHIIDENSDENIQIYSRYINEDYADTLADNSVWQNADNEELLKEIYTKMKGN